MNISIDFINFIEDKTTTLLRRLRKAYTNPKTYYFLFSDHFTKESLPIVNIMQTSYLEDRTQDPDIIPTTSHIDMRSINISK